MKYKSKPTAELKEFKKYLIASVGIAAAGMRQEGVRGKHWLESALENKQKRG